MSFFEEVRSVLTEVIPEKDHGEVLEAVCRALRLFDIDDEGELSFLVFNF
jgi:hypothetical protein